MQQNVPSNQARLNIQISPELKRKLAEVSAMEGKKFLFWFASALKKI